MKGDVQLKEFSSVNDPDEYAFEVTAEQPETDNEQPAEQLEVAKDTLRAAVEALQPLFYQRLEQYRQELNNL